VTLSWQGKKQKLDSQIQVLYRPAERTSLRLQMAALQRRNDLQQQLHKQRRPGVDAQAPQQLLLPQMLLELETMVKVQTRNLL